MKTQKVRKKNLNQNHLAPRELSVGIDVATSFNSTFIGLSNNQLFSSSAMISKIRWPKTSCSLSIWLARKCWKCQAAPSWISLEIANTDPSSSIILWIQALLYLVLITTWKNLEFWSPSLSYFFFAIWRILFFFFFKEESDTTCP